MKTKQTVYGVFALLFAALIAVDALFGSSMNASFFFLGMVIFSGLHLGEKVESKHKEKDAQ
ncbi:hypothetical protein [Moritella sp. F3]|uniref:hypothetical protein n=1 Tax=Moritella sp. F3 TaxID=2718882 RepID=UPI0018E107BD|nr:hypothetical protein [Moritella sp. F3]GIC77155.1 hypothetical protein FMO001_18820 [Moritella sp. F1]GIC82274.1 hypothetical protein FMO003_25550 [Moritella sp. F3]